MANKVCDDSYGGTEDLQWNVESGAGNLEANITEGEDISASVCFAEQ